jgi:aspartate/methionine/tyrosine aminotransferase
MGYWESSPLCDALAKRYQALHGVDIEPGRIILTCGASPALVLALSSAFQPGDRIAMARPGYVAYRGTVMALNMAPVELACGPASRYQLTAAMIEAMEPPPAGLIIASPANPTGTIIGAEELAAIAAVCKARGIRIVSDEIYHGLSYTGPTHSMLEFDPDALIINSFSKYFSMAGWRLGWLVAPADLREVARAYVGNLFLTAPSLGAGGDERYRRARRSCRHLCPQPRSAVGGLAEPRPHRDRAAGRRLLHLGRHRPPHSGQHGLLQAVADRNRRGHGAGRRL